MTKIWSNLSLNVDRRDSVHEKVLDAGSVEDVKRWVNIGECREISKAAVNDFNNDVLNSLSMLDYIVYSSEDDDSTALAPETYLSPEYVITASLNELELIADSSDVNGAT